MPTIGPQLPASVSKRKRPNDEREDDSESNDSIGPQPPGKVSDDGTTPKKTKVVMGPLLPSRDVKPEPAASKLNSDDESSDDDDFGPSLPSADDPSLAANRSVPTTAIAPNPIPSASKRDEWMTIAPKSGDWSQRVDPTKLKNRKFNTGSGAATTSSDAWHETPEQKQARLQREVLGIKSEKTVKSTASIATADPNQQETERRLKEYNAQRGPSLYQAHQSGKKVEEEDDPSARAFDREKDIGGGFELNASKRNDMVKNSANFSSRFSTAKYL